MGKNLGQSVDAYNRAVGSLELRVLPAARRFKEMGAAGGDEIETLDPVDKVTRSVDEGGTLPLTEIEAAEIVVGMMGEGGVS